MTAPTQQLPDLTAWKPLSDDDRIRVMKSMPDALNGFLKTWGWLTYAKAIEAECRAQNEVALGQQTARDVQAAALVVAEAGGYAAGKAYQASLGAPTARDVQAEAVAPSGYAYRYSDPFHPERTYLKFNDGTEVNGQRPIEAVPFYFAAPPASDVQPVGAVADRWQPDQRTVQWCYEQVCALYYAPCDTVDGETPCAGEAFHAVMDHFKAMLAAAPALQGESGATVATPEQMVEVALNASRYVWLRQPNPLSRAAHIAVLTKNGGWVAWGEQCDDAIDAAMNAHPAAAQSARIAALEAALQLVARTKSSEDRPEVQRAIDAARAALAGDAP